MRTGRPRKNVKRYRDGQSRGETADDIRSVVMTYRARQLKVAGLGPYLAEETKRRRERNRKSDHPLANPLNGTTLGMLRQRNKANNPRGITQRRQLLPVRTPLISIGHRENERTRIGECPQGQRDTSA